MATTPDELRAQAEARRSHLVANVDLLADKVTPSRIAQRRVQAVQGKWAGMKEHVMGSTHDTTGHLSDTASAGADQVMQIAGNIGESTTGVTRQVGDAVQQAPAQVRRQTKGSPLAAGLIAFGAGALAAALLPTTEAEQQAASQLVDRAQPLLEPAKQAVLDAADEVKDNLRKPAGQAVEAVKSTAQEAAQETRDQAQDSAHTTTTGLRDVGQDAVHDVRDQAGSTPARN